MALVWAISVAGIAGVHPARAQDPCPDKSSPPVVASDQLPDPYDPPDFKTQGGQILDGAIYDRSGNLLCVVPWDPSKLPAASDPGHEEAVKNQHGAWIYDGGAAFVRTASACRALVRQIRENQPEAGLKRLKLTNNQLLRRLAWVDAEGACNPAIRVCGRGASANCAEPSLPEYGSRYLAYAIEGGKETYYTSATGKHPVYDPDDKREEQEVRYLKLVCNSEIGGKIVNLYDDYFVNHGGNTRYGFAAIIKPSRWLTNPATQADLDALRDFKPKTDASGYTRAYEIAQRDMRLPHCLADVIASVSDPGATPFKPTDWPKGPPTSWAGGFGMKKGKSCGTKQVELNTESFGGLKTHTCLYLYGE